MKNNILITSISSKVILINLVRQAAKKFDKNIQIYGADIISNIIGIHFVDHFWEIPRITDLKLQSLIKYCSTNKIKYIIPTRDEDVLYFSSNKQILKENGIFIFCSNFDSVKFCFDKLKFYRNSKEDMMIPTFKNIEKIKKDSFVVKERFGAGSSNIGINLNKKEALKFAKKLNNPIFQPYIDGKEFSIDSYVDQNNRCIASIIRSRDLIIDGEAKITSVVKNSKLKKKISTFLEKHKIQGHSVLQVMTINNDFLILECNARFGGASSLSYKLGIESFYWFLIETNNKKITPKVNNKVLTQIRISQDIYLEN